MTRPDHIGADPALGVGAGQTRRGTPVDLAREVLELAHEDEIVTVCSVPDNKAAALARAVLRVADLADRMERATENKMDEWEDAYTDAYTIRVALNGDNA